MYVKTRQSSPSGRRPGFSLEHPQRVGIVGSWDRVYRIPTQSQLFAVPSSINHPVLVELSTYLYINEIR